MIFVAFVGFTLSNFLKLMYLLTAKNFGLFFDPGIPVCCFEVEDPQKITPPVIHLSAEQPGC